MVRWKVIVRSSLTITLLPSLISHFKPDGAVGSVRSALAVLVLLLGMLCFTPGVFAPMEGP